MNLTVSFSNSDVLLAVDVDPSMTVDDFKAYVLSESGFPASGVILFHRDERLSGTKTLESYGVQADDMILASRIEGGDDAPGAASVNPAQIEQMREAILYNPDMFSEFSDKMPELAQTLHDPERFRDAMASTQAAQLASILNPDSEEGQMRILDEINQAHVQSNLMTAMEEMPEAFAPVTMLYAPLYVNNHLVKALVDSGAQSTVMSPECAERCGLMHLLDKRMKGVALGVGQAKSLGRIHMAPIKVGNSFFPCSFTVLEGLPTELLFGLDMLKHHQASIDFAKNVLCLGHEQVEFLPESEIPQFSKLAVDPAPSAASAASASSTSLASGTASAAPAAPAAPPRSSTNLMPPATRPRSSSNPFTRAHEQDAVRSAASNAAPPSGPPPATGMPESEIAKLTNLGFSRDEAVKALREANGNVEVAGAILFGG